MPRPPTPQAIRNLLAVAGDRIADSLPPGWRSSVEARTTDGGIVRFVAPDGRRADVRALVRKRLDTRAAAEITFGANDRRLEVAEPTHTNDARGSPN